MTSRSRLGVVAAGILVVIVGVFAKLIVPGLPGDLLGSACYTALLFVLGALVLPRSHGVGLAVFAFVVSAVVEGWQLTGLPDAVARVVPLSRWVLGSTFVATDLLGYAVGALVTVTIDTAWQRSRQPGTRRPT